MFCAFALAPRTPALIPAPGTTPAGAFTRPPAASDTPAPTPTSTPTPVPSASVTLRPSSTATNTPTATNAPSPTRTYTPTPSPTPTATPTRTPTPSPTPTPTPTPTATPALSFSADPNPLEKGICATLSWDVRNVQTVHLFGGQFGAAPGGGVTGHDQRSVCPAASTTYTLRATSAGKMIDRVVTLAVHDTTSPPAPVAIEPSKSFTVNTCALNVSLRWSAVGDISGIARYEWQVYHLETLGPPGRTVKFAIVDDEDQAAGTTAVANLHDCDTFFLVVRAVDSVGNAGPFSSPLSFEVKANVVE
jgi:hypothetical protein